MVMFEVVAEFVVLSRGGGLGVVMSAEVEWMMVSIECIYSCWRGCWSCNGNDKIVDLVLLLVMMMHSSGCY